MEKRTDKNSYTILFAVAMVVIVGAVLAFTAQSLKGRITENRQIEKQQNILYAMGVNENDASNAKFTSKEIVGEEFKKYITKQVVIEGDKVSDNDQAYLIDIKKEQVFAKNPSHVRRLPLFIGSKESKTYYIIPVRGKGLWDAVWAYVSVNKEMVIQGAYFDHAGETPGLGANIKQRYFMDDFIGENLLDKSGNFVGVNITKSNADPKNNDKNDNEVDAIAGATITGDGVAAMIKSELKLYVPYFKNLKK